MWFLHEARHLPGGWCRDPLNQQGQKSNETKSSLKHMGSYVIILWSRESILYYYIILYYIPSKRHFVDIARAHCSLLFGSRNNDILYGIPYTVYLYTYTQTLYLAYMVHMFILWYNLFPGVEIGRLPLINIPAQKSGIPTKGRNRIQWLLDGSLFLKGIVCWV